MRKIKKIIILMAIILVIIDPNTIAGDAGTSYDYDKLIIFTVQPHSYNAKIGEEITFTLKITNNSYSTATINSVGKAFAGPEYQKYYFDEPVRIAAKETKDVQVTMPVLPTYDWYKENGEYYVDFHIKLFYYAYSNTTEDELFSWYSYQTNKESITSNNIFDGRDVMEINIVDNHSEFTVLEYNKSSHFKYKAFIDNSYTISNISEDADFRLDDTEYIKVYNNNYINDLSLSGFMSNNADVDTITSNYYNSRLSRVADNGRVKLSAIAKMGDNYYYTSVETIYPNVFVECPAISYTPIVTDGKSYIRITNEGEKCLENIYYSSYTDIYYSTYSESIDIDISDNPQRILSINPGEYYDIYVESELPDDDFFVVMGRQVSDGIVWWYFREYNSSILGRTYFDDVEFFTPQPTAVIDESQNIAITPTPCHTCTPTPYITNEPYQAIPQPTRTEYIQGLLGLVFIILLAGFAVAVILYVRGRNKT